MPPALSATPAPALGPPADGVFHLTARAPRSAAAARRRLRSRAPFFAGTAQANTLRLSFVTATLEKIERG